MHIKKSLVLVTLFFLNEKKAQTIILTQKLIKFQITSVKNSMQWPTGRIEVARSINEIEIGAPASINNKCTIKFSKKVLLLRTVHKIPHCKHY